MWGMIRGMRGIRTRMFQPFYISALSSSSSFNKYARSGCFSYACEDLIWTPAYWHYQSTKLLVVSDTVMHCIMGIIGKLPVLSFRSEDGMQVCNNSSSYITLFFFFFSTSKSWFIMHARADRIILKFKAGCENPDRQVSTSVMFATLQLQDQIYCTNRGSFSLAVWLTH